MERYLATLLFIAGWVDSIHAQNIYADSQTNYTSGACAFCSITNPNNAVDVIDLTNYAKLNQPVAVLGASLNQRLYFPSSGTAGTTVTVVVENDNLGLLDATVLGGFQVKLKNTGTTLDVIPISGISINLLSGSTTKYTLQFTACCDFDEVEVSLLSGIAGALTKLRVYYAYFPAITLPVELLDFKAYHANDKIKLTWQTASENNNDYFSLEKEAGSGSFVNIMNIKGAGSSNSLINYSVFDEHPEKDVIHYRLSQTDFNGKQKYLKSIFINNNKNDELRFQQMPFKDELKFHFKPDEEGEYRFCIYTDSGIKILDEARNLRQGACTEIILKPETSKTGIYLLKISGKKEQVIQKIIKR